MKFQVTIWSASIAIVIIIAWSAKVLLPAASSGKYKKEVRIAQQWELPDELLEISGLAYLGEEHFACIQDEKGTIYIYNTGSNKIDREISFAGEGDFEGIAVNDNTAYAVRSDGHIFIIENYTTDQMKVKDYPTFLEEVHNVEGIAMDAANNRLLLIVKDEDPGSKEMKGIYAFDLKTKKMAKKPVYTIPFDDPVFRGDKDRGEEKVFSPSDIDIHPLTGMIYLVDGKKSKLLMIDKKGTLQPLIKMQENTFRQPEGLTFSPKGELFISNEGKKKPANIIKLAQ